MAKEKGSETHLGVETHMLIHRNYIKTESWKPLYISERSVRSKDA